MSDDWNASDAADAPVEALTADGRVLVTGGVWQEATDELRDLYREVEERRRLFGDAAREVGDL